MARRGQFGRRRSSGGNLTSLIIALMREQRAAEDRAIFDAYNNGGLFKGQPVDDKRILSYIKGRRDGFSRDDPLYDEWNNRLIQTEFSIGEQKIGLRFKEGKVGAGAVASWYRGQLSKIPKDSAFYREVAGRAAEWAKSAASAARGRARSNATKALNAKLAKNYERQSAYLTLDAWLTEYAKRAGIIAGNQTLTDADATDLRALIESGLPGPTGANITYEDWRAASKDYYRALGQEIQILDAAGRGTKEKRAARTKFMQQTLVRQNALDDREKYEVAREDYDRTVAAANGDPYAIIKANQEYAQTLANIRDNALSATDLDANDPEFIGGLNNEIEAVLTGKSKGATVTDLQSTTTESVTTSDAEALARSADDAMFDADALSRGTAFYGQTEPGGPLRVVAFPPNAASDPFGRNGLGEEYQASITKINGENRVIYLRGEAINASVILDSENRVVDPSTISPQDLVNGIRDGALSIETENERHVGYTFTNPVNGTTKFGVIRADGSMVFTEHNPFATGLFSFEGIDGRTVFASDAEVDAKGRATPILEGLTQPLDLSSNADAFLTDSTVAPKDLLALVANGVPGMSEEDVAAYTARLQRKEARRLRELSTRDIGLADSRTTFAHQQESNPINDFLRAARSSDLGQSLIGAVDAMAGVLRANMPPPSERTKDDLFVPPPPPIAPSMGATAGALTGLTGGLALPKPGSAAPTGATAGALLGVTAPKITAPAPTGATAGLLLGTVPTAPAPKPPPTPTQTLR